MKEEEIENLLSRTRSLQDIFHNFSISIKETKEDIEKSYKYYWILKHSDINIASLYTLIQDIEKDCKYDIEEFLNLLKLLLDLEQHLMKINRKGRCEQCITEENKTTIKKWYMKKEEIKEKWEEKINKFYKLRNELTLTCSLIIRKIKLFSSGKEEKAKKIKYKHELTNKSTINIKEEKLKILEGSEIEIPRKKLEKLNENEKIMFDLIKDENSVENLTLLTDIFNKESKTELSKSQVGRIFSSASKKLTFYTEKENKKIKIKPLFKEGKPPMIIYKFLR